ncbi:glycoside hydrolase family 16 protein [Mycena filopes]|nr:glycoside hydrolase family 16 protein [Mycena filopes]
MSSHSQQSSYPFAQPIKPAQKRGRVLKIAALATLVVLIIVAAAISYPLVKHFQAKNKAASGGTGNAALTNGALPNISSWGLSAIDLATPSAAHTIPSYHDPSKTMTLVFSDEFETAGRSFYPGDDPYWEAANLHYWQTGDLEWYDPSAVTTKDGALEITLSKVDDISTNYGLQYRSAMISTWNKFCFTGGILVSSVTLPGANNVLGLWPAVWAMGNLGRAGYGASLDGMWPYSYDTCDVGTLPNQTLPTGLGPQAALTSGGPNKDSELSFLPGQRLSACTCSGESHPGPAAPAGSGNLFVGRSAPEIDVFEATIGGPDGAHVGQVSQSAQWAPMDASYISFNSTANLIIPHPDPSGTNAGIEGAAQNAFVGNVFQQTTSVLSKTNQDCYQLSGTGCFATYGFEYKPGYADAYISWINDNELVWTMNSPLVGADTQTEIGARQVPVEPMYIIMNLGLSESFGFIDFDHLTFPAVMRVDWVRVYQDASDPSQTVGCDPKGFPTQAYISDYLEAYTNANLTTWVDDFKQTIPKNRLLDTC